MKALSAAALLSLAPALARAQDASPTESKLWWMWIALAVVLVGALIAIFAAHEPRPHHR